MKANAYKTAGLNFECSVKLLLMPTSALPAWNRQQVGLFGSQTAAGSRAAVGLESKGSPDEQFVSIAFSGFCL